ncbi:hypothetical protein [Arhodomonas sp. SL1]|uniref:hypothetical protein n=1 Tax=Arhodomonas sp. SL1 TaxID=3425691 RepID=UPI003F885475
MSELSTRPYELRDRPRSGTAPGTLVAPPGSHAPVINVMAYDDDHLLEHWEITLEQLEGDRGTQTAVGGCTRTW